MRKLRSLIGFCAKPLSQGQQVLPQGRWQHAYSAVSAAFIAFMVYAALFGTFHTHLIGAVFLLIMLPVTFLTRTVNSKASRITALDGALALIAFACCAYYIWNRHFYNAFYEGVTPIPVTDKLVGVALIVISIEACRRAVGFGLFSLIIAMLLYVIFGQSISGTFNHPPVALSYFVQMQTVTSNGVFNVPLQVADSYALLFITFGALFHLAGGDDLLLGLASSVTGGVAGGPAKACVIASGLYGSISGSPVADVATTGPLTISLMKRTGVSSVRAGAIEAAASTGGALLPPIMGAVVFIMSDFTGISYGTIAKQAIAVALLYYLGVMLVVHGDAVRNNEGEVPAEFRLGYITIMRRYWMHAIPIIVLLYFLAAGYSATYVASAAIVAAIASSWLGKQHIGLRGFAGACGEVVNRMVPLTAAVVVAGVVLGAIALTGLDEKIATLILTISQGTLWPSLIMSAVMLIMLGMGMPTPAVYVMGYALIVPVLETKFGFGAFEANFFVVLFSAMSSITPPVAVAAYAAGSVADAPPMQIAPMACRYAAAGFLLPFYGLLHPGIYLIGSASRIAGDLFLALVMLVFMGSCLTGYLPGRMLMRRFSRIVVGLAAVSILAGSPEVQYLGVLIGVMVLTCSRMKFLGNILGAPLSIGRAVVIERGGSEPLCFEDRRVMGSDPSARGGVDR